MRFKGIKKIYLTMAAVPLGLLPAYGYAQSLPITVTASEDLNFGSFIPNAGGTITVNTVGARSSSGSVTLIGGGGIEREGLLSISASPSFPIDVSMTASSFNMNDGGNAMAVNNFDLGGGPGNPIVISVTGTANTIPVGATLVVGGSQASGSYTGTFTINANYQ